MPHKVDTSIVDITGPTGRGKTTLMVGLGLSYSIRLSLPIVTNMHLENLPEGVRAIQISSSRQMLESGDCVMMWDEADNSFPSAAGWSSIAREKKLVELVKAVRKRDVKALLFTSQLMRAAKNTLRKNAKYAIIPCGSLDRLGRPEFLMWNDIDQFEQQRATGSYAGGVLCRCDWRLEDLDAMFDTKETIIVEWDLEEEKPREYKCQYCPKILDNEHNAKTHVETQHADKVAEAWKTVEKSAKSASSFYSAKAKEQQVEKAKGS